MHACDRVAIRIRLEPIFAAQLSRLIRDLRGEEAAA
jgi:hypothetical protein